MTEKKKQQRPFTPLQIKALYEKLQLMQQDPVILSYQLNGASSTNRVIHTGELKREYRKGNLLLVFPVTELTGFLQREKKMRQQLSLE